MHAAGFLSIDCGLEATSSGYKDENTGIVYVSDGPYVDSGENHRVSAGKESGIQRRYVTLRSFPSGVRNCYALPTIAGASYLIRLEFFYGNYDGKDSSSTLQFDLHLGVDYWKTVHADGDLVHEALFVAWASWAPVCLVNTGRGTPFVSTVERRTLASGQYQPDLTANQSMSLYPDDPYDRMWWPMPSEWSDPTWKNLSTASTIKQSSNYAEPSVVMQTAVEAFSINTTLRIGIQDKTPNKFMLLAHIADFQNSQLRQFNFSTRVDGEPFQYSPPYLSAGTVGNIDWFTAEDGVYAFILKATSASKLPPMLNAFEMYTLISHDNPMTFPADCKLFLYIYSILCFLWFTLLHSCNSSVNETLNWRTRIRIAVEAAQGHIVQRVRKKIAAGNISLVADARLGGAYEVSSMWKVVDTALLCTADAGAQRPAMSAVVVQLKESLAMEEARADSGVRGSTTSTVSDTISATTFGPSAR
ncbi:hypothetical protein ABZP36_034253 [Zizania latifolia]